MTRHGMTLLETLIVIAVLAVLLAIGSTGLVRYRQTLALQEAALQVQTDLGWARTEARRTSVGWTLTATKGSATYLLKSALSERPRVLPNGAIFHADSDTTVGFTAPYGITSAANRQLRLQMPWGATARLNIVGSTGKVVLQRE